MYRNKMQTLNRKRTLTTMEGSEHRSWCVHPRLWCKQSGSSVVQSCSPCIHRLRKNPSYVMRCAFCKVGWLDLSRFLGGGLFLQVKVRQCWCFAEDLAGFSHWHSLFQPRWNWAAGLAPFTKKMSCVPIAFLMTIDFFGV